MSGPEGRALIVANARKQGALELSADIRVELAARGWESELLAFEGKPSDAPVVSGFDLGISLGGDGTVLYSARLLARHDVPILPVNLGTLGFIAWVRAGEWKERLADCVEGRLLPSERIMLEIEARRRHERPTRFIALNDGVISGSGPARIVSLRVAASGARLGSYRSDGAIVATPTGSTAYSLAAGGPVVAPEMDAMIFNPICPFALSNRPLVLPGSEWIDIQISEGQRTPIVLTVDGQENFPLEEGDAVVFRRASERARIYCAGRSNFYDVLRSKLNWSGGPDA
ncbi:MAG: NAD(+)/NADH kinase [Spirochaetales bacterium]|nr:NAD(+)/NADH kinase [Spirochaetales bacterium]